VFLTDMSPSLIDNLPEVLKSLRTRPMFVMRLDVRKLLIVGATPSACRRNWRGAKRLFRGGAAFRRGVGRGQRLADGTQRWRHDIECSAGLKTKDEALIGMTYHGIRHGPPDVVARLERGEVVDPASYYFRINPLFETAAANYDWLNRVVAVGIGHRRGDRPIYSIFEVL